MSQYLPQQKTLPERMASIETLLTSLIRAFSEYQAEQKEEHKTLTNTLSEMQKQLNSHVNEGGDNLKKITYEVIKYVVLIGVGALITKLFT